MITAYIIARKRGYETAKFPGLQELAIRFIAALPGLLLIFVIFGGIRAGIFTAVESASVAVLYALAVTALLYRDLPWSEFFAACMRAAKMSGVILFVISSAAAFGWLMAYLEVPTKAVEAISALTDSPLGILILINIALLILGTFMDMAPLIIICTPIFLPIAKAFSIDPCSSASSLC